MGELDSVYSALQSANDKGDKDTAATLIRYIGSRQSTGAQVPSNMPARIYPQGSPQDQQARASIPQPNDPVQAKLASQDPGITPYQTKYPTSMPVGDTEGMPDSMGGDYPSIPTRIYSPQQIEAAKKGVNVDATAGVSTFRANFAAQQAQRDSLVAQQIKQKYGPDTLTRSGPDAPSGDVEWYDKDAKQWKTAGDSAGGLAVNAIPGATEAVFGGLGMLSPAPVLTSAVGAGVGRGLGLAAKNYIGEQMGVNGTTDRRNDPSAVNEGLKSGGMALATGALLSGVPAGFRLLTQGKDVVDSATAGSILRSYQTNSKIVDEINEATAPFSGGLKLDLGTAKTAAMPDPTTGRVNVHAANLASQQPLLMQYEPLAEKEQARRLNNENVLDLYWQHKIENPYAFPNISNDNWQADLRSAYQDLKDGTLGPFQQKVEAAIADAQKGAQGAQPQQLDATTGGQLVRTTVAKAAKDSSDLKDAAWATYETKARYSANGAGSDLSVPVTPELVSTLQAFDTMSEKAMLTSQKGQAARYRLRDPADIAAGDSTPQILDASGAPMRPKLADGVGSDGQSYDLAMMDRTIKDLREEARHAAAGPVGTEMSDANRNRLLSKLVDARQQFMAKPENAELSAALDQAEAETVRHAQNFKRSFAADFLQKQPDGGMAISDANVLNTIMKNKDVAGARQLADVVNGEPGAKKAVLDYVNAYYQRVATKTNTITGERTLNPGGHERFMANVYPAVEPFLDPVDKAAFQQLGGIAKRVGQATKELKATNAAWADTDSGKLGNRLSTETFVNQFFDGSKSFGDTNMAFIGKNLGSDAMDKTKAGIISELNNRARVDGQVNVQALSGIFAPLEARFGRYFGKDFTDNVNKYIAAQRGMDTQFAATPLVSGNSAITPVMRAALGPLSAENRKLSFFRDMRKKSYAGRLEQALYDPKSLGDLVSNVEADRASRATYAAGAGVIADESTHR